VLALVIFVITYTGVALTRLPWIRIDRPSAAFLGAVTMVLFGVLTPEQAIESIDWGTISLLLGMMVLVAALSRDGHVTWAANAVFGGARTQRAFLGRVVLVTAAASALLVNDTAVLVLTPLVLAFCLDRGISPLPFLIAEAMASNIGSVPSVVGNPQNVLVALQSGISFERFAIHLLPVALLSGVVLLAVVWWLYRDKLSTPLAQANPASSPSLMPSRKLSPLVMSLVIIGFATSSWTGLELPLIALVGAGVILLTSSESPGELLTRVDWVLLLFFASLFVVMGGISRQDFFADAVNAIRLSADVEGVAWVHGSALALSQVISNVPYTILMLPLLSDLATLASGAIPIVSGQNQESSDLLWLSLASGATLAGNLTLIGAVANLIVAQLAEREGVRIGFWEFTKAGVIVTLITMTLSVGLLLAQWWLGWLS
jgi:Na+/H+ antiporter NhaD/arsenite permease-like protein